MKAKIIEKQHLNYIRQIIQDTEHDKFCTEELISATSKFFLFENEINQTFGIIGMKNLDFDSKKGEFKFFLCKENYNFINEMLEILNYAFYELKLLEIFCEDSNASISIRHIAERLGFKNKNNSSKYFITPFLLLEANGYSTLKFDDKGDERGKLTVIEGNIDIPFEIKRTFYIFDTDGDMTRGCHANIKTKFVLINVSGK